MPRGAEEKNSSDIGKFPWSDCAEGKVFYFNPILEDYSKDDIIQRPEKNETKLKAGVPYCISGNVFFAGDGNYNATAAYHNEDGKWMHGETIDNANLLVSFFDPTYLNSSNPVVCRIVPSEDMTLYMFPILPSFYIAFTNADDVILYYLLVSNNISTLSASTNQIGYSNNDDVEEQYNFLQIFSLEKRKIEVIQDTESPVLYYNYSMNNDEQQIESKTGNFSLEGYITSFASSPNISQGYNATIKVSSLESNSGFKLPEFNIIAPNKNALFDVTVDDITGSYEFNIPFEDSTESPIDSSSDTNEENSTVYSFTKPPSSSINIKTVVIIVIVVLVVIVAITVALLIFIPIQDNNSDSEVVVNHKHELNKECHSDSNSGAYYRNKDIEVWCEYRVFY